jgi:hypothetical protein
MVKRRQLSDFLKKYLYNKLYSQSMITTEYVWDKVWYSTRPDLYLLLHVNIEIEITKHIRQIKATK